MAYLPIHECLIFMLSLDLIYYRHIYICIYIYLCINIYIYVLHLYLYIYIPVPSNGSIFVEVSYNFDALSVPDSQRQRTISSLARQLGVAEKLQVGEQLGGVTSLAWEDTWSPYLRSHPHTPGRYPRCFTNSLWISFFVVGLGKFGVSSQSMWAKSLTIGFMYGNDIYLQL